MRRVLLAAVLVMFAACGGGDDASFPLGAYGAGWSTVGAGIGYLEFAADGTGTVRGLGESDLVEIPFTYTIEGDRIELTSAAGGCHPDEIGTYAWSLDDVVLHVALLDDPCATRASTISTQDWNSLGEMPVMAAEAGGRPVTVATDVGEITWHVLSGQRYQSPIMAFRDGFAALIGDEAGPLVMTSDNGMSWQAISSPPSAPELLATADDELYVVGGESLDEVYKTTDRGETWTSLSIEPPVTGAVLTDRLFDYVVAGPSGVLLRAGPSLWALGDDSLELGPSLWVLGGDSFELVESAPSWTHTILAVEHGFFAVSYLGPDAPKSYWTSDDGRTWTDLKAVPHDLDAQSAFRGKVFGATSPDWGVTSPDGGRTWSEPKLRPGGTGDWLTAGDAGYFAIETVNFAPPVGVVWASPDDVTWERVLNPWPPPFMGQPVLNGDTILIPSEICDPERDHCQWLDWVGAID